jgi:hypothetical protein
MVWEEHDAIKDHAGGQQSKLAINSVVMTKDVMKGHLLSGLHWWVAETILDQ